jgi:hypothetical protein
MAIDEPPLHPNLDGVFPTVIHQRNSRHTLLDTIQHDPSQPDQTFQH